MGNCNDHDLNLACSIKDVEGKPLKNELARAVFGKREAVWSFPNSGYGVVDGLRECESA